MLASSSVLHMRSSADAATISGTLEIAIEREALRPPSDPDPGDTVRLPIFEVLPPPGVPRHLELV